MHLRRGDVVTVAASGDFGKPRPAVVVQSDVFPYEHASVIVCQMTSTLVDAPIPLRVQSRLTQRFPHNKPDKDEELEDERTHCVSHRLMSDRELADLRIRRLAMLLDPAG